MLHVCAESGCVKNLRILCTALAKHELIADHIDSSCDVRSRQIADYLSIASSLSVYVLFDKSMAEQAGMTALHYAAKAHPRCIALLIEHGANVNAVNKVNLKAVARILVLIVSSWPLCFRTCAGGKHLTAFCSNKFSAVDGADDVRKCLRMH